MKPQLKPIEIRKVLKKQRIKRKIGFFIALCWVLWCFYSTLMFSLEFGYNTTQTWMMNYGFSTAIEILLKDACVAIVVSTIMVCIIVFKVKIKNNAIKNNS